MNNCEKSDNKSNPSLLTVELRKKSLAHGASFRLTNPIYTGRKEDFSTTGASQNGSRTYFKEVKGPAKVQAFLKMKNAMKGSIYLLLQVKYLHGIAVYFIQLPSPKKQTLKNYDRFLMANGWFLPPF